MTQLNSLRGFEDAGQVFVRPPKLISEANLDTRLLGAKKANIAQYDANSFVTGSCIPIYNLRNKFVAQAFKVNNDGSISAGNVYEYNMPTGDESMSTTLMNETAPGVLSFIGRMDWSGSYSMVGGTASTTDGQVLNQASVTEYGDYNTNNNAHPQGGGLVGPGTWTASDTMGNRQEAYVGYGPNYGRYVFYNSVGNQETSTSQIDNYSSTTGSCQFIQHYTDNSKRMGWSYNHEDSSDYHIGLITSGPSFSDKGNLGNFSGAANDNYHYWGAYTWVNTSSPGNGNNRAFFISRNGKCWEWDKDGNSQSECDFVGYPTECADITACAYMFNQFAVGKNLVFLSTQAGGNLYSITRQTGGGLSRPLYTFTPLGPFLSSEVFHTFKNSTNLNLMNTAFTRMRFCGPNNEYIMVQKNNNIKVYDATSIYPTAGDYL